MAAHSKFLLMISLRQRAGEDSARLGKRATLYGRWRRTPAEDMRMKLKKARKSKKRATEKEVIRHVIKLEEQVWKAAQARDAKQFAELVPPDAIMIFRSGMVRQPEYLAGMAGRTVGHSEIHGMQGFMPNAKTVILIYTTERLGSENGRKFPQATVIESTTWIKRGKRWVAILNQETPVAAGSDADAADSR
jgi:hypothetical protein